MWYPHELYRSEEFFLWELPLHMNGHLPLCSTCANQQTLLLQDYLTTRLDTWIVMQTEVNPVSYIATYIIILSDSIEH